MNLTNKLDLLEYIYEEIDPDIFLYKLTETSPFLLIDKTDNRQKEFTLDLLVNYLDVTEFNLVKLELIIDSVLTQQALFHKMILDDHLKLLGLTTSELTKMEQDLKDTLKDITKGYVKKRLYIVETE